MGFYKLNCHCIDKMLRIVVPMEFIIFTVNSKLVLKSLSTLQNIYITAITDIVIEIDVSRTHNFSEEKSYRII